MEGDNRVSRSGTDNGNGAEPRPDHQQAQVVDECYPETQSRRDSNGAIQTMPIGKAAGRETLVVGLRLCNSRHGRLAALDATNGGGERERMVDVHALQWAFGLDWGGPSCWGQAAGGHT